jgi:hypothetical protein
MEIYCAFHMAVQIDTDSFITLGSTAKLQMHDLISGLL